MARFGRAFPMPIQRAKGATSSFTATLTTYSTAGSYTYTIPTGCTKVDVVALGGGSGGGGGSGSGLGNPGNWAWATVTVSQVGPTISGSVGAGGAGGVYGGGVGGDTTATSTGWSGLVAAGAQNTGGSTTSPGNISFNGRTYIGAPVISLTIGQTGAVPGGGGGPSYYFYAGGAGGQGEIWFYAY